MVDETTGAPKIIAPGYTFGTVTDQIATVVLTKEDSALLDGRFRGRVLAAAGVPVVGNGSAGQGRGRLGQPPAPTMWGFDITNFVWWIGIGHAGTLISAILLLLKPAAGATPSNRFAEAHDVVRGGLRGHVPAAAPGPFRGCSTGCSHTPTPWGCSRIYPQPAGVGRVRGFRTYASGVAGCSGTWA